MSGYTKLSNAIVTSTVWREPATTRVVWITMLALADQHGEVQASVPGLADLARVSIAECEAALATFLAPDPYSRTKDHDGRRIEAIDGGWELLNHKKYRHLYSDDERREHTAERVRRFRARQKDVTPDVTLGNAGNGKQKQKQIQKQKKELQPPCDADASPPDVVAVPTPDYQAEFDALRKLYPKREGAQGWPKAAYRYTMARKRGVSFEAIKRGVESYAALMLATDKEGTVYVCQAQTFFGPQKRWEEEYVAAPAPPSPMDAEYERIAAEANDVSRMSA